MKKTFLLGIIFLFLLAFSPNVFAIIFNGTTNTDERHVFSSDSAFGNIVERDVNYTPVGDEPSWSAVLFSWGGPLANATGVIDVATAGFGVSAVGDILVLTMGPELEDEEPTEEEEEEVIEEESSGVPSSGGGGGGSSSRDTYALIVGDKLTVLINGEAHTIEITEIRETSAVLTIESTTIVVEINEGETEEIDLDEDGVADMAITLDNVSELRKITITVEDLTLREEETREEVEDQINKWSGMLQSSDGDMKYKADCSNCKKSTMVPFEPQEGRPVYCKECMFKIKNGDLKPDTGFVASRSFRQKESASTGPLADLGIEFNSSGQKAEAPKTEAHGKTA